MTGSWHAQAAKTRVGAWLLWVGLGGVSGANGAGGAPPSSAPMPAPAAASSLDLSGWPDDLAALRRRGTLVLGLQDSAMPFAYRPAGGGESIGYSVDLCQQVVRRVDQALQELPGGRGQPALRVEVVPVTPRTRIALLLSRRIDLECGSTTASAARLRLGSGQPDAGVAFSPMIFWSDVAVAVPRSPAYAGIRHVQQLDALSRIRPVVTTFGSTSVRHLSAFELRLAQPVRIEYANSHAEASARLEQGTAGGFVMDRVLLRSRLDPQRFRLLDGSVGSDAGEPYGLMLRKADTALRELSTRTLRELQRSGELERLYRRWFLAPIPQPQDSGVRAGLRPAIGLSMAAPLAEAWRRLPTNDAGVAVDVGISGDHGDPSEPAGGRR